MRISDWSSDGCSSDLEDQKDQQARRLAGLPYCPKQRATAEFLIDEKADRDRKGDCHGRRFRRRRDAAIDAAEDQNRQQRSEEHTSELQSLMRNTYAVFCFKTKNNYNTPTTSKH